MRCGRRGELARVMTKQFAARVSASSNERFVGLDNNSIQIDACDPDRIEPEERFVICLKSFEHVAPPCLPARGFGLVT